MKKLIYTGPEPEKNKTHDPIDEQIKSAIHHSWAQDLEPVRIKIRPRALVDLMMSVNFICGLDVCKKMAFMGVPVEEAFDIEGDFELECDFL